MYFDQRQILVKNPSMNTVYTEANHGMFRISFLILITHAVLFEETCCLNP